MEVSKLEMGHYKGLSISLFLKFIHFQRQMALASLVVTANELCLTSFMLLWPVYSTDFLNFSDNASLWTKFVCWPSSKGDTAIVSFLTHWLAFYMLPTHIRASGRAYLSHELSVPSLYVFTWLRNGGVKKEMKNASPFSDTKEY